MTHIFDLFKSSTFEINHIFFHSDLVPFCINSVFLNQLSTLFFIFVFKIASKKSSFWTYEFQLNPFIKNEAFLKKWNSNYFKRSTIQKKFITVLYFKNYYKIINF